MSATKDAINSTFRKILNYTAEIIMSIFLFIVICIPLVFALPMWLEYMLTNVPRDQLAINPVGWIGYEGTFWLTMFLGLISSSIGYAYIIRIKPGVTTSAEEEPAGDTRKPVKERVEETAAEDIEEETAAEDIEEEIAAEDIEEEIAAEDQEDIEEFEIEDSEESPEDIEDDE